MNGGKLVIETELKTKKLEDGLAKLEREFETLKRQEDIARDKLEKLKNSLNDPKLSNSKTAKIKDQINSLTIQLDKIVDKEDAYVDKIAQANMQIDALNNNTQQVNNETNKLGTTNTKVFEKGVKNLKRFALGIIGIRSAYTMARRAASAYMAQDEELSNKVRSFWIGLGSFLAPILEMLSDVMLKALGYLNVFIKALTGIDYIARANAKALKKQADATKEATNSLSSLDEIENIDLGSKMDEKSLADFGYIDIPELDPKIVKMLEDMANWLKENWDWIWKVGAALAGVFLVSKLAGVLGGIGALIGGAGTGLVGLLALLSAAAIAWTIKLTIDGIEAIDKVIEASNAWKKNNDDAIKEFKKKTKATKDYTKVTKDEATALSNYLTTNTKKSASQLDVLEEQKSWFTDLTGQTKDLTKEQQDWLKSTQKNVDEMIKLKEAGKLTQEQQEDFAGTLYSLINKASSLGLNTDKLREKYEKLTGRSYKLDLANNLDKVMEKFKGVKKAAEDVGNGKYNIKTDMDNKAVNKLEGLIDTLEMTANSGILGFSSVAKGLLPIAKQRLRQIRGYAYGGLVTQPTQALIGEAGYNEYVVPERSDYLSRLANNIIENMPAGGLSDDLLLELNRNITELANRPIVINVDGKALAQATYQDFKNEENRLNSSTSVSIK